MPENVTLANIGKKPVSTIPMSYAFSCNIGPLCRMAQKWRNIGLSLKNRDEIYYFLQHTTSFNLYTFIHACKVMIYAYKVRPPISRMANLHRMQFSSIFRPLLMLHGYDRPLDNYLKSLHNSPIFRVQHWLICCIEICNSLKLLHATLANMQKRAFLCRKIWPFLLLCCMGFYK